MNVSLDYEWLKGIKLDNNGTFPGFAGVKKSLDKTWTNFGRGQLLDI